MRKIFVGIALVVSLISSVHAGGILADFLSPIIGKENAKGLDRWHAGVKNRLPVYGKLESILSGGARHVIKELAVESGWSSLAALIEASRLDAINSGVHPVPEEIKNRLKGHFSDALLNKVRFRVGRGNDVLLPSRSFAWGGASAITLVDVIVFKNLSDAQRNVHL